LLRVIETEILRRTHLRVNVPLLATPRTVEVKKKKEDPHFLMLL
jgi:hypothetical protein